MKRKVNLAIIGAGGIGRLWAVGIGEAKGVHLRMVADVDEKRAASIARRFPGCRAVQDWHIIVSNTDIDAVLIATPHTWLAPISHAALTAGKHVLCEKPAGVTAREVAKNILLAKKKNLIFMPGFNHRYHPAFTKAMEVVEKGGIGKLNFVRARYGFGGRPGYGKEWRLSKEIAGGGELLDQGMHMIDMARWFLGDFEEVQGFAENFFWGGGVEDNGFLLMRTKKGQVASLHASWTNWDWVHSFEIFGDKGYLQVDGLDQRYHGPERLVWGKRDKTFAHPHKRKYVFDKEQKHDSMRREMEDFTRAIHGGTARKRFPRGEDAYEALRIVEKVYKNNHGAIKK